jgi:hypothetical protein
MRAVRVVLIVVCVLLVAVVDPRAVPAIIAAVRGDHAG